MKRFIRSLISTLKITLFCSFSFLHSLCAEISEIGVITQGNENALSLDLEEAIRLAIDRNRKMQGAVFCVRSAEFNLIASQSEFDLKIIPMGDTGYIGGGKAGSGMTVGGGVVFDKKFPFGTRITVNPSLLKAAKDFQSKLQVRISQPLFKGTNKEYTFSEIRRAEFRYRSACRAYCLTVNQMTMRTIELFYEVAKQEQLVKLNQECYEQLLAFDRAAKIKERIGLLDAADVCRSEMELKQAKEVLNLAIESLQDAKDALSNILLLPSGTEIRIQTSFNHLLELEISPEEAILTAFQNRIELDQGLDQIAESRRLAKVVKIQSLPDVNLVIDFSNIGYGEEFTGAFGCKRESTWGVGFTTSTGACASAGRFARERSLMDVKTAEREYVEIENWIAYEVKRALRTLKRVQTKIKSQQQQIQQTAAELKLAKVKFSRELNDQFSVLQAEKAYCVSKGNLILAQIELSAAEYHLQAVLGLLVEKI